MSGWRTPHATNGVKSQAWRTILLECVASPVRLSLDSCADVGVFICRPNKFGSRELDKRRYELEQLREEKDQESMDSTLQQMAEVQAGFPIGWPTRLTQILV